MIEIIVLSRTNIAEHDTVSKQVIEDETFHQSNLWYPRHQEAECEMYVLISDYSKSFKERRAAKMYNPKNLLW